MAVKADPNRLYKNTETGKWMKVDLSVPSKFREATNKEIAAYDVGPINVVAGQGLDYAKRWNVESFSNDASALSDFLMSDGMTIVKPTGGGRSFDLAISRDGGKTYKLIDPAPTRYLKAPIAGPGAGHGKIGATIGNAALQVVTDPGEFGRDVLDLSVDAIQTILTGLATVGGAVAGPITGALAGGGSEALRQSVGGLQGMNKRMEPIPIMLNTAGGGMTRGAASGIKGARKLGPVMEEAAANFVGAKADTDIAAQGVLKLRIKDAAKSGSAVADIERDADTFRKMIAQLTEDQFPETPIVRAMEAQATGTVNIVDVLEPLAELTRKKVGQEVKTETSRIVKASEGTFKEARTAAGEIGKSGSKYQKGVRIDYTDKVPEPSRFENEVRGTVADKSKSSKSMEGTVRKETDTTTKTTKFVDIEDMQSYQAGLKAWEDSDLPEKSADVISDIYGVLRLAGVNDPTKVPATIARDILRTAQHIGAQNKIYKGREVTVPFKKEIGSLAGRLNKELRAAVDSTVPVDPETNMAYSSLMDKISERMKELDSWQQAAGVWEYETATDAAGRAVALQSKRPLDDLVGNKKMAGTMRNFWGDSHQTMERMIQQLEHTFGVNVRPQFQRAALSERIGKEGTHGAMGYMPQLAAGGGVKLGGAMGSMGLITGAGAYAATGNPITGIAAGLASSLLPAIASSPRFIIGAGKFAAEHGLGAKVAGVQTALESKKAAAGMYAAVKAMGSRPLQGGERADTTPRPERVEMPQ